MNQSVSVIFYNGLTSKPHQALLTAIDSEIVLVTYDDHGLKKQKIQINQLRLTHTPVENRWVLKFGQEIQIVLLSHDMPVWLSMTQQKQSQDELNLQSRFKFIPKLSLIIFSSFLFVILSFAILNWMMPFFSKTVALQLPENTLKGLGDQTQQYIWVMTKPSQLAYGQQQLIRAQYLSKIAQEHPAKLLFREGGALGANALALSNNSIMITDELVEMIHSDQEILAILAHEQGHLIQRHSLQQALSHSGLSLLYMTITGRYSDLSMFSPKDILNTEYSQKFEQEADLFALKLMQQQNIEVSHFANVLQRFSDETVPVKQFEPTSPNNVGHLSLHPTTESRIQMVRDFEKQHQ